MLQLHWHLSIPLTKHDRQLLSATLNDCCVSKAYELACLRVPVEVGDQVLLPTQCISFPHRADEERAWARKTQEELGKRAEVLAAAEARSEAASRDLDRQTAQLQVDRLATPPGVMTHQ